uniref:Uncharacterized protein n=1 Tax=Arundo donax TaxID=35708 RepID=A0A0A9D4H9_ARUDO
MGKLSMHRKYHSIWISETFTGTFYFQLRCQKSKDSTLFFILVDGTYHSHNIRNIGSSSTSNTRSSWHGIQGSIF